jgi:hypothetical protein
MGLVALHHSLASYQGWPEYERIVGGKFFLMDSLEDGHERSASGFRDGCEIPVEIPDPEHPVTRGLVPFTIHDEAYSAFSVEPSVHPLLLTRHRESGPVLGWAKPYGRGRVVYLQSGHDRRAYSHPAFRAILRNAIRWVARRSPEDREALALFNGEDLCGWRAEGKARFSVEEGILVGRQGPGGGAGDLLSEAEFDDLDLEVVWAMDWPGNSGVWSATRVRTGPIRRTSSSGRTPSPGPERSTPGAGRSSPPTRTPRSSLGTGGTPSTSGPGRTGCPCA